MGEKTEARRRGSRPVLQVDVLTADMIAGKWGVSGSDRPAPHPYVVKPRGAPPLP